MDRAISGYSEEQPADSGGGEEESAPVESEPAAPAPMKAAASCKGRLENRPKIHVVARILFASVVHVAADL